MRKGDRVGWHSRAEGNLSGRVAAIVKPRQYPWAALSPSQQKAIPLSRSMGGGVRNSQSYVCEAHGRLYWPAAAKLRKAGA